jgi:hypothetical protein
MTREFLATIPISDYQEIELQDIHQITMAQAYNLQTSKVAPAKATPPKSKAKLAQSNLGNANNKPLNEAAIVHKAPPTTPSSPAIDSPMDVESPNKMTPNQSHPNPDQTHPTPLALANNKSPKNDKGSTSKKTPSQPHPMTLAPTTTTLATNASPKNDKYSMKAGSVNIELYTNTGGKSHTINRKETANLKPFTLCTLGSSNKLKLSTTGSGKPTEKPAV